MIETPKLIFPDEILDKNDPTIQDHSLDALRYTTFNQLGSLIPKNALGSIFPKVGKIMGCNCIESVE